MENMSFVPLLLKINMKINVSVYGFYPIVKDHDDTYYATDIPWTVYRINTTVSKLESRNLMEDRSLLHFG